ncbi:MAG: sugar ABC transporter permease [Lachnospiraceae bacterium]|nr:sugar ABC transporter permease [Lachnospiraceae bacterium]
MAGLIMAFKENPNMLRAGNPVQAILDADWVGLSNFRTMFSEPEIFQAIKNTLEISLLQIVIVFPIPIALAILINELRGKRVKRSLQFTMYIPHFLSWVTVAGIFGAVLSQSTGLVNNIMEFLGHDRVAFMSNKDTIRGVLISTHAWKNIGYSSMTYMAAILALDLDQFESAKIDGATKWQQIMHITIPGILPTIAVMFVLRVGGLMEAGFEQIYVMYSAYTKESIDILGTYTYRLIRESGLRPEYALSTAVGLFNGLIAVTLVLTSNWFSKKFLKSGLW